jgi:hypothetical protein
MTRKCGKSARRVGVGTEVETEAGGNGELIVRFLKIEARDDSNRRQRMMPALTVD